MTFSNVAGVTLYRIEKLFPWISQIISYNVISYLWVSEICFQIDTVASNGKF